MFVGVGGTEASLVRKPMVEHLTLKPSEHPENDGVSKPHLPCPIKSNFVCMQKGRLVAYICPSNMVESHLENISLWVGRCLGDHV